VRAKPAGGKGFPRGKKKERAGILTVVGATFGLPCKGTRIPGTGTSRALKGANKIDRGPWKDMSRKRRS